jgi:hypothetical protein
MELPDRAALIAALRVRRNQVLLALFVLLLAVRIALPYVLRPIIVSQADAALVGRIALRDLDLSLIRGGVTLHGFEVYADELPPGPGPVEPKPPLFATERLWVNVSWLALVLKTIRIEEFELDDFTVRLDRLKDGLVLPKPTPSTQPEPAQPEPETSSGWAFAADSLVLHKGSVLFRDYTVGKEPQRFELAIPNLAARQLALRFDPSGHEPGHVALEADIGDGKISFEADLEQKQAGPATHSNIVLANLPIGGVRVYLKMFGWSDLSGTLDASIDHRFETDGAHEVSGVLSLSDLQVRVPKLDRPALTFKKLSVALDKVDVVKQHAAVSDVTLTGAHVVVDPKGKLILPILEPPAEVEPSEPPKSAAPAPSAPARPWTWTLKRARVEGAEVELLGAADPLVLGVDAQVRALASPTTGVSPVSLAVREGDGGLQLDGDLTLEPLSWKGKLALHELALAPLAARAPAPGADLLRAGRARADLEIILAGRGSSAPGVSDLRVAGSVGLAGLEVGKPGDKDFAAAWKDLAIQIRELTVEPAIGGDPAVPRAVAVTLDRVQLSEPDITITRTEKGIALPEIGGGAPSAEAPAPAPAPAAAAPPADVHAKITKLIVSHGRVRISDRSVKPYYEGRVEQLDFAGGNVQWPPLKLDPFLLKLKGLHGAVLQVHGGINPPPGVTRIRAELDSLPLAPFNPYVSASGFSLSSGSLGLKSTAHMEGPGYDSSTDVAIQELELGGAEGEALFEKDFGIPLSMAIGLLKDQQGVITLNVPVAGDRGGTHVGLGSLAGQALRKALLGALASPLKLLGVSTQDGKVQSLRPDPVEFLPGAAEPSEAGNARIDQLAVLLASAPGISLTLHGATSEGDERALRERALLAELERTTGFRALGSIGEIGTRRAVRLHLQALAKAEPAPELDADQKAWLESHVQAESLASGALEELAAKRASALSDKLVHDKGVDATRVTVAAPAPARSLPIPGVAIDVGARSAPAQ